MTRHQDVTDARAAADEWAAEIATVAATMSVRILIPIAVTVLSVG